jgi:predicted 3-demethylubiquinone-9 3-methyltransferase (glyoxalase superfamily)
MCIDSPVKHPFSFTPSMSLFVDCESEAELEAVFVQHSTGGSVLMPLDNYGFSTRFGWVNDRFGESWQLNLA